MEILLSFPIFYLPRYTRLCIQKAKLQLGEPLCIATVVGLALPLFSQLDKLATFLTSAEEEGGAPTALLDRASLLTTLLTARKLGATIIVVDPCEANAAKYASRFSLGEILASLQAKAL